MPLVPVLSRIERTGVRIDADELKAQSADLAERAAGAGGARLRRRRAQVQLGSPKQIGAIFFDELKLPVVAKTPKGAPSTSEAVLEQLAADGHELPRHHPGAPRADQAALHLHRQAAGDGQPGHRPGAHQLPPGRRRHRAAVVVGPEPAEHPHPQRGRPAHPPRLRAGAGLPDAGRGLLQIELRIMAHLSGDERLLAAFAPAPTSTAPPLPRSSGCRRRRSAPSSAAAPRPSTSGSSTACPPSGSPASSASSAASRRSTSTSTSPATPACARSWTASAQARRQATSRPYSAAGSIWPTSTTAINQLRSRRRAHRHQRPHAGHRRGHHQARHDPRR
jgi:hypothetical protein